ncbi:MAG: hypothetical protein JJ956_15840 [Pseudomonadales bacterium]|nr:hypothetical protein [Pseudomonadales bacterium]
MSMFTKVIGSALLILLPVSLSKAELPISVDDIFVQQDNIRFGLSTQYLNRQDDIDSLGTINSDQLLLGLSVRYGISPKTEVSANTSFRYWNERAYLLGKEFSDSGSQWESLSIGVSHKLSDDYLRPALLVFGEFVVAERPSRAPSQVGYGKTYKMGAATYKSIDPILLSGLFVAEYHAERIINGLDVEHGISLRLEPKVAFIVNNRVTLTGGIRWQWRERSRINGSHSGINLTETSLAMGVGYHVSEKLTLSFEGDFAVTNDRGSSLTLHFIYR